MARSDYLHDKATRCMERAERFRQQNRPHLVAAQLERCHWCLESALKEYPGNHSAGFLMIGCCFAMGKIPEAKRAAVDLYNSLTEQQRQHLEDPILHLAIAHASEKLGHSKDAIAYLTEAADLYTQHPEPCLSLALILASNGRSALGAVTARSALQRSEDMVEPGPLTPASPRNLREDERARALTTLGQCLMEQGQFEEAEERLLEVQQMGDSAGEAGPSAGRVLEVLRERTGSLDVQESSKTKQKDERSGVAKAALDELAARRRAQEDSPTKPAIFTEMKYRSPEAEKTAVDARSRSSDPMGPQLGTLQLQPNFSADFPPVLSREPTADTVREPTGIDMSEVSRRIPFLKKTPSSELEAGGVKRVGPGQHMVMSDMDLMSGLMPMTRAANPTNQSSGASPSCEDEAQIWCQDACRRPIVCSFFKVA